MRSASRLQITAAILATLVVGALLPATASANHNDDFWNDPAPLARNLERSTTQMSTHAGPSPVGSRTRTTGRLLRREQPGEMGSTVWFGVPGTASRSP